MRINKYVARATGMARRKVDDLIESGQILVNGIPARIGQPINDTDQVSLAGKTLHIPTYTYLMLHKPTGYVCSRQSQKGDQTVYELLPSQYRNLKLVGRLDKDSSGLILLTDDGDFAHRMLHPSFGKSKTYEVELDNKISKKDAQSVESGIALEDGKSILKLQKIDGPKIILTMTEGRNRQIRRTFAALGYEVIKLHRTSIGDISLTNLPEGDYKTIELTD